MRGLILSLAASALLAPTVANAEACPENVNSRFEKSLGKAQAWLNDDEAVYLPTGTSKLGVAVSYVIVDSSMRWNGKSYDNVGIEKLRFRLQNVQRVSGSPYPASILREFDGDYSGSGCASGGGESCEAAGLSPGGFGTLVSASIGEGDLYVRDSAYGPALDKVRADYMLDADPAFLVCEYQAEG
jgi:hypothetical protein